MKAHYIRAMDAVHNACLFVAGACLVVITIIVPYGVFTRYALNSAASWPEPMAILLMIVLSFLSAVVCYREHLHIGVGVLPAFLDEPAKSVLGFFLELLLNFAEQANHALGVCDTLFSESFRCRVVRHGSEQAELRLRGAE